MENMLNSQIRFSCEKCKYKTNKKSSFDNHINSMKHKKSIENMPKYAQCFTCVNCGKQYKDNSGLWRHNKKCISNNNKYTCNTYNDINDKNLIMMLIKENKEIKDMMFEIMKKWNYE